jgi:hypothetical protein
MPETEAEYWNARFNEEQRHIQIYYQDIGWAAIRPSSVYKPKLFIDDNQWCALYGEDLQNGVAGFGDTPEKAYEDFDRNWTTKLG